MAGKFYDPSTAPKVFSVVWCKYPYRGAGLTPSDESRPVLVLDVRDRIYDPTGEVFADITVAYGTGAENIPQPNVLQDLLLNPPEYGALGLHKPTIFQLGTDNRRRLPWASKYFVPNEYVASQNIICGILTESQKSRVLTCFEFRGLTFPLP
ncbi:hypothetical protein [Bradyrhizobium sp. USDA 4529]